MKFQDLQRISSGDTSVHRAAFFRVVLRRLVNHTAIDLWSSFHGPVLRLGALLQKRETTGMRRSCAPSCRCPDKTQRLCASLSCHGTLNTISSLSRLPKHRGAVWGTPGRDQSKICRPDRYTSLVWASENKRTADEGKGINSPSSLHLSPTSLAFSLPFCNSFVYNTTFCLFNCPSSFFTHYELQSVQYI